MQLQPKRSARRRAEPHRAGLERCSPRATEIPAALSCARRDRHPRRRRVHALRVAPADHLDRRAREHPLPLARDARSGDCAAPRRAHAAHHVREGCAPRRRAWLDAFGMFLVVASSCCCSPRRRSSTFRKTSTSSRQCWRSAKVTASGAVVVGTALMLLTASRGCSRERTGNRSLVTGSLVAVGCGCAVAAVADAAASWATCNLVIFFVVHARRSASSSACRSRSPSALRRCPIWPSRRPRRCRSCRTAWRKACRTCSCSRCRCSCFSAC